MTGEKEHELPSGHWIGLTEAITWAVTGNCRTDAQWHEESNREPDENFEKWGASGGARALLPFAERIIENKPPQLPDDPYHKERAVAEYESANRALARVQAFREDPREYCRQARETIAAEDALLERWHMFEHLLFSEFCASGEVRIVAMEHDRRTGRVDGDPKPIPQNFFTFPVEMRFGTGVLVPKNRWDWEDKPASGDVISDLVGNYQERRPSYAHPKISRDHLLLVRAEYLSRIGQQSGEPEVGSASPKSTIKAEAQCRRLLIELMRSGPQQHPKQKYLTDVRARGIRVSGKAFERAWGMAKAEVDNPDWGRPGPKTS